MAKASIDERIAKVQDAIAKEELILEQSTSKLKKLKADLKALEAEEYSNQMKAMESFLKSKGLNPKNALDILNRNYPSDAAESTATIS